MAILFWGGYEQAGSTINLFADRYTRLEVLGFSFPSSWFQAVPAMFVIVLAPTFAWLWLRLGRYNPSLPIKFALGLFFMGLGFLLLLMPAGAIAQSGGSLHVSPWWLIAWFFMSELGELCIYPVGMSAVTKLSPARIVGVMMGVWFLSIAFGDKLAGWAAGFISNTPLPTLFGVMGLALVAAAAVMLLLTRPINRLTEGT
jgi:POT family proton-dependent oligopeptide transporter